MISQPFIAHGLHIYIWTLSPFFATSTLDRKTIGVLSLAFMCIWTLSPFATSTLDREPTVCSLWSLCAICRASLVEPLLLQLPLDCSALPSAQISVLQLSHETVTDTAGSWNSVSPFLKVCTQSSKCLLSPGFLRCGFLCKFVCLCPQ